MSLPTIVVGVCFLLPVISTSLLVVVSGQGNPEGFISVDCGITADESYNDKVTGLTYISDAGFIETGTSYDISSTYATPDVSEQLRSLRSFPNESRNCYSLSPLTQGGKYLVRASFLHGGYDGEISLQSPVQFDLYLGVNFWTTITISNPSAIGTAEVLTVVEANSVSVCLVNTGLGTPFISSLELRPLLMSTYPAVNASTSLITEHRKDIGSLADGPMRYPADPYDRLWYPYIGNCKPISTDSEVSNDASDLFVVPSAVLQTAVTTIAEVDPGFEYALKAPAERDGLSAQRYFFLHFAEIQRDVSRSITVYIQDGPPISITPVYLKASHVYSVVPSSDLSYNVSIQRTSSSSAPPLLNAIEVYRLMRRHEVETDAGDVDAIMQIKTHYQIKRNWMGDPCAPSDFAWDGLTCSYVSSVPSRIIALNLSSSGLTGAIPPSLANLKALKTLDLSGNDLTGTIPDFLSKLTSLQLLNLTGNQLSGSVPLDLLSRAKNDTLTLSLDSNPGLCQTEGSCKKKGSATIVVILSVVASIVTVLVVVIFLCGIKRWWKGLGSENANLTPQKEAPVGQLIHNQEVQQFTYAELEKITNNFQREIGKGGFGTVYHGCLENGTQVAVKLRSQSSSQGDTELITEAQLLSRIHHRNLVPFIGYCSEESHMALVYEHMAQGNLEEHLKGDAGTPGIMCWGRRLSIALQTAQGLEYLHDGCKPPIIHRDVKTTNILCNEQLEAKIADFGLSKSYNSNLTHVSTRAVGTPGYLDPEYYRTSQLTEKSDVYSFGVVLLQLITGRPAVLPGPSLLLDWVRQWISVGDIDPLIDLRLKQEYDTNSVWKVVEIAMTCVAKHPTQRPAMASVVVQLKEAVALEASQGRTQSHSGSDPMPFAIDQIGSMTLKGPAAR